MKVPKYVIEMIEEGRITVASKEEQLEVDPIGYAFRIYRKSNTQRDSTFHEEVIRICLWAQREYSESRVVREKWYTDKEHRKPYYKRDYHLVLITDPVAIRMEKIIKSVKKNIE